MNDHRCLVADDHPAVLAVMRALVEENGFEGVGATTGPAAVRTAAAEQPPFALVDLRMPGLSGLDFLRALHEAAPNMRIAVYTGEIDGALAADALGCGARAIVLKEAPLEDVARALQALRDGGTYVDSAVAASTLGTTAAAKCEELTARERQVLRLLSTGLGYEEIAKQLALGVETVRTHVRKACERLGATTRTQVVATAIRRGLLD